MSIDINSNLRREVAALTGHETTMTRDGDSDLLSKVTELASHAVRRVQRGAEIPPRLLDIDDAGRYVSMSDKGIRELIVQGELPYIQKVPGRSPYLIDIKDLDRWIEAKKVRP